MVRADDDQQDLVDGEEDQDASVESEDIIMEGTEAETGNMDAAATATDTDAEKVMLLVQYFSIVTPIALGSKTQSIDGHPKQPTQPTWLSMVSSSYIAV